MVQLEDTLSSLRNTRTNTLNGINYRRPARQSPRKRKERNEKQRKKDRCLSTNEARLYTADKLKTWSISPLCLLAWILPGIDAHVPNGCSRDLLLLVLTFIYSPVRMLAHASNRTRAHRTGIRTNRRIRDRFPMSGVTPVERRAAGFFLCRFKVLEYRNWKGINNGYRSRELINEMRKHP